MRFAAGAVLRRAKRDVKSTGKWAPSGYDAGWMIKGRERHVVVDFLEVPCAIPQGGRKVDVSADNPHPRRFAAPPLPLKRERG